MALTIRCPSCDQALKVPAEACGRHGRCPICNTKFIIPKPSELMEQTVSHWLEEDLDKLMNERDEPVAPSQTKQVPTERSHSPRTVEEEKPSPPSTPPTRTSRPIAPKAASHLASGDPVFAEAVQESPPASSPPAPRSAPASSAGRYPTSLHITELIPHLVVREVTQQEVIFHFDSLWLEHDGFRAAMPSRCAVCGSDNVNDLVARPVVFADRAPENGRSPRELQLGHEHALKNRSLAAINAITPHIEGIAKPFDSYLPYFTCPRHHQVLLEARTYTRSEGGSTCEVRIPDSITALSWLARVNGVCGPEYALLEADLSSINSDAWNLLPETSRQRLNVWCKFAPGERFQTYLCDADMSKHDYGLAGIVITSERMIFHKYHHHGEARLDDDATLVIRRSGQVASLSLENSAGRFKVGKLQAKDLALLIESLSDNSKIKITFTTGPAVE
ncbi:MAG: hypothetical protein IT443_10155 [Phycisphaeraceae bacterium]|nr:hypothetical protein [Phycisphaeraceae bacterium]